MKEYVYTYQHNNYYLENGGNTIAFGEDACACLVVMPHQYKVQIGNEVVRTSSCDEYRIEVTCHGGTRFLDAAGNTVATFEDTDKTYPQCQLRYTDDTLAVAFGHTETVDNYPNCDGEHDRWDTRWVTVCENAFFFRKSET